MKLVAYLRVSTDRQAEQGLGLDVQKAQIKQWASANKHRVVRWTSDEGLSGSNGLDGRVGLLAAFASLQEGAEGLVVYRLDRLARDLILQEQLLAEAWRLGCRVHSTSITEDAYLAPDGAEAEADPSRALIRQVLGAVAQYERSMIRLRLRSGKALKAARGGYVGGAPGFGVRADGGELVADEKEAETRRRAIALRREGLSLREIARQLDAEGRAPKRAASWHAETVRKLVATPTSGEWPQS